MTALKVRNVKTDEEKEISVDGVFIAVGIVPGSGKFKDLVKMDESGYIIAGEDGVTSTPGIFAAGDIRELLGTTRKYALALLEYTDAHKLTIRVGDKRFCGEAAD